jgi:MFS family permease
MAPVSAEDAEAQPVRIGGPGARDGATRSRRRLARLVQVEAGAFGILKSLNDAFVNPLLIQRGAGPIALGIYNSGANLFGFGSGWFGPRIAAKSNSVRRTVLACVLLGRLVFLLLAIYLIVFRSGGVPLIIALLLCWGIGEGLVLPLWASFIAGMVGPGERGRWLAMKATASTLSAMPIMAGVVLLLLYATQEEALPIAYLMAAIAGLASLAMIARIFRAHGDGALPPARSFRALPAEPGARRFLGGVWLFWFGAGLVWPVLPAYVIDELHAPTVYFAIAQLMAVTIGVIVQRRWGRLSDDKGASYVLMLSGIGAAIVPALWGVVPVYWIGFGVEAFASASWPGHMLGLTLRSVELATHENDRSSLLGWTNLAQGAGACISPLLASWLVLYTGTIPILFISAALRLLGAVVMSRPTLGGITFTRARAA